ncbi:hypothetical protein GCM10007989_06810 [Devosia pacifica]|uniref:Flagellar protein FlgN n=1 Tax=Devosia pacifica TaxID=1335967 RepID=A0A918RXH2_9HYPH|nr:hypothetical protein [Devosia pacifica]GHA14749.1 hypothetical protein GCM10007989_06810 [Devosia pacifica]
MSPAQQRLMALDALSGTELCSRAIASLEALADTMNRETMLLRAGSFRDAAPLAAEKGQLAQDYVGLARAVQRQAERLKAEVPADFERLKASSDRLATQMSENLRVLATARKVTDDILSDVAKTVGDQSRAKTYGQQGQMSAAKADSARGIAVNRAL